MYFECVTAYEVNYILPTAEQNFNNMSRIELRAYLVAHPNDREVFNIFVDRFASQTNSETFDIPKSNNDFEQVENLIRQKLEQIRNK